jgi:hypothetical protein
MSRRKTRPNLVRDTRTSFASLASRTASCSAVTGKGKQCLRAAPTLCHGNRWTAEDASGVSELRNSDDSMRRACASTSTT